MIHSIFLAGQKKLTILYYKGKQYLRLILTEPEKELNGIRETRLHVYLLLFMFVSLPDIFLRPRKTWTISYWTTVYYKTACSIKKEEKNQRMAKRSSSLSLSRFRVRVRKESSNMLPSPHGSQSYFDCYIPGLSISDILYSRSRPMFWHINFTHSEGQHVFNLLQNEGIYSL